MVNFRLNFVIRITGFGNLDWFFQIDQLKDAKNLAFCKFDWLIAKFINMLFDKQPEIHDTRPQSYNDNSVTVSSLHTAHYHVTTNYTHMNCTTFVATFKLCIPICN